MAGLTFKAMVNGEAVCIRGGKPSVVASGKNNLKIAWPVINSGATIYIEFTEHTISVYSEKLTGVQWFLDFETAEGAELPFQEINPKMVKALFDNTGYSVKAAEGQFIREKNSVFILQPEKNRIRLQF